MAFIPALHLAPAATEPPLTNQLAGHPSPYLALHGADPVPWQDWSGQVIATAKKTNRLIFISSGYFSCHWCHVMQRESFSDDHIARELAGLAVPVKLDRELQPALDQWLIDFTERTAGHAGWPLNVFLTPDGYPLVGFVYMPKDDFANALRQLQELWRQDEATLREAALAAFNAMTPQLATYSGALPQSGMGEKLHELQIAQALAGADEIAGGFGEQNKFPLSPLLLSLLEAQQRRPNDRLAEFLGLTLERMAELGLRDHIGGGFFRYTVDPAWDLPHFEKMLYDNAMLARVYLSAAAVLQRPAYRAVAYDTLDFMLREMQSSDGGFYASLSAVDDKDVEGGYYLWQTDELKKILSADEMAVAEAVWGARGAAWLDAGHHLKQVATLAEAAAALNLDAAMVGERLDSARQKLFQARRQRVLPVDNKVLAGWNGLALEALSLAAAQEARYRPAAEKLYGLLAGTMWDGKQLRRFIHHGRPAGQVGLEDYAYVAAGIAAWGEVSGDKGAWQTAEAIGLTALRRFHNQHGWQPSEQLLIPYAARELILPEGTTPSPSATLLQTLLKIARRQQDPQKEQDLRRQIARYAGIDNAALANAPLWYGGHINLISRLAAAE